MRRFLLITILLALCATPSFAQYAGSWTQTWDFNDGLQGWTLSQGGGYWVDPAAMPSGPTLPDGAASGAGSGNIYAPDSTRFQIDVASTNSFVLQVDAYLPNLMPLNVDTYMPGNGIKDAGIGAITEVEGKHMYISGSGTNGVKIRDHSWDNTDRTRSWLLEEAGLTKAEMWDDWVTLQFVYNLNGSGKFTGYAYTPWDSAVHDGPGWYAFAEYDIHPEVAKQYVDTLILGSVNPLSNSWTQAQFDNVKFADLTVPEPGSIVALGAGMVGMAGFAIRRKK